MDTIKLVSLMSDNVSFVYRGVADYITRRTGVRVRLVEDVPWQERERMLDRAQVQVGFICGLSYVRKVDQQNLGLELLVAPVRQAERYQGRPIYFSDVVVRWDSRFRSFADLRGASWAYNEPGSHSGYVLTCYHLATLGETSGYFGRVVESGAHKASLKMVVEGQIDASAIDSTMLESQFMLDPELASQVRIVESFGPSPTPPLVVSSSVPNVLRQSLRDVLLHMHEDDEGLAILGEGLLARCVEVHDADYDEIRRMVRVAERARLG